MSSIHISGVLPPEDAQIGVQQDGVKRAVLHITKWVIAGHFKESNMQNRVPVPRVDRDPLPDFDAVPRKYRHDGWTPERQRAFIEALADTGSVRRAALQVNMSSVACYYLRRQPGAEGFRRAWEAALDFGVQRLKDIAFERAIEGQLVPVFVAGKLMGFRRKKNDRLLMFCLRMNARGDDGRRLSAHYFNPAPSGEGRLGPSRAGEGQPLSSFGTSITQPRLTRAEKDDDNAALIHSFNPVEMTLPEIEAMQAMLTEAAARHNATAPADDLGASFLSIGPKSNPYIGELEDELGPNDPDFIPYREDEPDWRELADEPVDEVARQAEIDAAVASVLAAKAEAKTTSLPSGDRGGTQN
jgi:hypothetical protein